MTDDDFPEDFYFTIHLAVQTNLALNKTCADMARNMQIAWNRTESVKDQWRESFAETLHHISVHHSASRIYPDNEDIKNFMQDNIATLFAASAQSEHVKKDARYFTEKILSEGWTAASQSFESDMSPV